MTTLCCPFVQVHTVPLTGEIISLITNLEKMSQFIEVCQPPFFNVPLVLKVSTAQKDQVNLFIPSRLFDFTRNLFQKDKKTIFEMICVVSVGFDPVILMRQN